MEGDSFLSLASESALAAVLDDYFREPLSDPFEDEDDEDWRRYTGLPTVTPLPSVPAEAIPTEEVDNIYEVHGRY
jgi:hypothetical protein